MDDKTIFKFLEDEEAAVEYCVEKGLIKAFHVCCGTEVPYVFRKTKKTTGFYFRCKKNECRKELSIRKNTFFENTHLSIGQIMGLIFYFVHNETKIKNIKRKLNIKTDETIVDWLSYCREVCWFYFDRHPQLLGGPNKIVEVDEAVLVRRKYERGRGVLSQWCFAMRDVETKNCVIIVVPNRKKETIIPLIQKHIFIGSMIYTDGAKIYDCLTSLGYGHRKCNHSIGEFVNHETGATVNHVESLWQRVKNESKNRFGTHRTTLQSHILHFMWREKFGNDFETFLDHIRNLYDPYNY